MSACDSAGKRIYSSEGLVGLSWAFLRAGAQNVVASLWEVNDASTPKLMDVFYAAIARGRSQNWLFDQQNYRYCTPKALTAGLSFGPPLSYTRAPDHPMSILQPKR
ncbi:CHAT domain-containing protein [Tunturiibacter empetritectus]|uniref:CHAT domain-containing protein n=1 Tax=Tunturiibacter empetritectus TaxID=3069691 RepID=UPI003D9BD4BA